MKKIIEWPDLIEGDIFREADFRQKVEAVDWSAYQGKKILIKGCSQVEVPIWAYCVVTAKLVGAGAEVTFGEIKSPIPVT